MKHNLQRYYAVIRSIAAVFTAAGIIFYILHINSAIFLTPLGLGLFIYIFQSKKENKEEERLLFSSIFVLTIFLSTVLISVITIIAHQSATTVNISILEALAFLYFGLLAASLIFRFISVKLLGITISYFTLFVALIIVMFALFSNL